MKKIFKLAAIAVSMALVAGLVACSSGDDDVVDTSTGKYLLAAQIGKYVDSITYREDVTDAEIKSLKDAHKAVMDMLGDCADCLDAYFTDLRGRLSSSDLVSKYYVGVATDHFKYLKSYGTEKDHHKVYVYRSAITNALNYVNWAKNTVDRIGATDEEKIFDSKLNRKQAENMKVYIDAAAALKATLTDDDSKKCETTIKAADTVIEAFGKLEKVDRTEIVKVIAAVTNMYTDIETNVRDKIEYK